MTERPTLEQVRDVIATMVEQSTRGWIGEGNEIVRELLEYIDGNSPETPDSWKQGMDQWAYLVTDDPGQTRGPFDSRERAIEFLAELPEKATSPSRWGRTADRASYAVLTREEYKAATRPGLTHMGRKP